MTDFTDRESHRSASFSPWWPLDLIRSIGSKAQYFLDAFRLPRLLTRATDRPGEPLTEAELRTRGWALVQALLPSDFVCSAGTGADAQDIYEIARPEGQPGERLRLSLALYRFPAEPPILLIAIAAAASG